MNITLHELAQEFRAAAETLQADDLPDEVIQDTLESISMPLEEKAKSVAAFARNLESTASAIKEAEAEMSRRRKALENRAEWLRGYLLSNMQACGISKIECPYFRISVRANPESVCIEDEAQIPADYMREIPARLEPDKAAMKQAMKDGFSVPGAKLVRTQRLEIK